MADLTTGREAAIDDFLGILDLSRQGDTWVGNTPDWFGPVVFGGIGLALTISAACRDTPPGSRLHSVHAHFLRPVGGGKEIAFETDVIKAGRSFNLHRVTATQDGKPVIMMTCSFTADADGYVYDIAGIPEGVPLPEKLPGPDSDEDQGPWEARWLGPSPLRPDWTGVGGRPHDLENDTTGMISLDHAAWFHRPARVDEWLLQDVQSLVNAGGRGTLRGVIRNTRGEIVASMAQEMLLIPTP
jgi:acyl-CoA thioesterase II